MNFLGIYIDDELLWKEQIFNVNNKLSKCVGILYKVKHVFTRNWLLKLYNAFLLPHITYCNVIWCSTHQSYLNEVIVNQKNLKLALNVPRNTPSDVVFSESKVLELSNIHKVHICLFMYKLYSHLLPASYEFPCTINNQIHNHDTRCSQKYHLPKPNITKFKFFLSYKGPSLWNMLPDSIKFSSSLQSVKMLLNAFFQNA